LKDVSAAGETPAHPENAEGFVSSSEPIIELRRVSKAFGQQRVLDDIDLAVERGSATVIIGRSGTGKSVLLKHIVGLLRPDKGEVYFDGQRIDRLRERQLVPIRRQISFVFQLNALFDSMSVAENVAFPLVHNAPKRLSKKHIAAEVAHCLELVGLAGFEKKRPADLSGGEKKRVALARAIAVDPPPRVILYDEPTAGLDPQRSDVINKVIRTLQSEIQVTSIVVTHDMKSANEVGDRVLLLWGGRFIADASPAELVSQRDPRVTRFINGEADPIDLAKLEAGRARA
jgi:phospholipid/cholesterol/gamma-HCH transport system ATP-binding protein